MKSKQRIFRAVRWGVRLGTVAGVTTAIVLTAGVAAPAVSAMPLVEAWAQIWSAREKDKREKAIANHRSCFDKDFAEFYGNEDLEDEEMADINGLFGRHA
jgi:hypothetical protein